MAIKDEKAKKVIEEPITAKAVEEERTYCYIGPNLPDGVLKKNSLIIGTKKAIKEKYKNEIEKYKQLEQLIIPVENLAEAKAKVESDGNILNKYYRDIASTVAANKEGGK
ncbi:hypothetical protein [Anaerococcus degeneri]|uniref:Uncharacterized protein n=1 Tax=Anaerococcus degeneri TaxID=361500 RepID=A0ABS7YWF4_9FIRM|nr:hypothetical protein [Anaerococcus degeneri]MBP2015705.1 hypothetical protein [Anaerococcus degeneri]MCA2096067.1 hypothetical protein [Anaerococcus degeneri]